MKTIGLLGGMSWESTSSYYTALNKGIKNKLGGLHSAKISMVSVDFAEIENYQRLGDWDKTASILCAAAKSVQASGADFLLICTNTMHKVFDQIEQSITIPLLHIADTTAHQLIADGVKCVALIGTAFTMEEDFYKGRLFQNHNINVIIPNENDRDIIHNVIYKELCLGEINRNSKKEYLRIIDKLYADGAEAVILGCTEIALLVNQSDTDVPLYDTTQIHAQAAIDHAIN